jgi:hypothetical protein
VLLAVIFATPFLRKPALITDDFVRKELLIWGGIFLFAIFMLFPPSRPLWDVIEMVAYVRAPWRMQMLIMFGFIFLLAVYSRYGLGSSGKVRRGDAMAFLLLVIFLNMTTLSPATPEASARRVVMLPHNNMLSFASTQWTDKKYIQIEPFYREYIKNKPASSVSSQSGDAVITSVDWSYGKIAFKTSSKRQETIRLEHFYFPTWRAEIDGVEAELKPSEDGKGLMVVEVPAGNHDVQILLDWQKTLPNYYLSIILLSVISFLLIISSFFIDLRALRKQSI